MTSLIEYAPAASIGEIFVGIGGLILTITVAYILYRLYIKIIQLMDVTIERSVKYEILEESFLDKIAEKKGVDLNKEMLKRNLLKDNNKKSIRRKIEEQIYQEMFSKK